MRSNTLANFLGQGWAALLSLAFVPLYIDLLGIEAWGLVGFLSLMQAWLILLDMGLTPTLAREMARYEAGALSPPAIRNLMRSLEYVYGILAVVVIAGVWLAAPWLATRWLQASSLSSATVTGAIATMGIVVATRMVEQVYRGAIQGLQRQVWLNVALAALATLRWAGVIPVLVWISPTVKAFFVWQGLVSVLSVAVLAAKTYQLLPPVDAATRFDVAALMRIRRFAGGMAVTTALAILLTQMDKLLLSKLVSLEEFGYYALAASATAILSYVTGPIVGAVIPLFTGQVAREETRALVESYHRACQWVAAAVIPVGLVLAVYSEPLLHLWIGRPDVAAHSAPLLSLLAAGTMLNCLMHVPYAMQIAHGWNGFAARVNGIGVMVILPTILWAVPRYGAVGSAAAWLAFNVAYVAIAVHFMHRHLLAGEKWRWYGDAVIRPLVAGIGVILCIRLWLDMPARGPAVPLALAGILLAVTVGTGLAVPVTRDFMFARLRALRGASFKG